MNYNEAYSKIIDAYFKDEIEPMNSQLCFCGTLAPDDGWLIQDKKIRYPYSPDEYSEMEDALFNSFQKRGIWLYMEPHKNKVLNGYEIALFEGMCAALDVLKEIHISKGEIIDEGIPFKKRELLKTEKI